MKPMTNEEYLFSGAICPFCRSPEIELGGNMNAGERKYYLPHVCRACGKEWDEVYTLTHYEPVQEEK